MSIQTLESTTDERQQGMTLLPLISGGAALALVVAAGIGLWASTDRGSEVTVRGGPVTPVITESISEGAAPPMGGLAELYREQAAAANSGSRHRSEPAPTVYVARSEAQAEAQRALIAETAGLHAELGLSPPEATVVVAGSPAERERAARMLAELNAVRAELRAAEIQLVELPDGATVTPNGAIAPTGAVVAGVVELPFTVFVVDSAEAAGRLAQELEVIMPAGGALPRDVGREQVVVVTTSEDAAAARATIDRLRLTHGRDGVQVVDWRPSPAVVHSLGDDRGSIAQPLADQPGDLP